MPQTDYISKLLDIGSINILDLNFDEKTIVVAFKLERRPHICPDCGGITDKVHDYREQRVKDTPGFILNVVIAALTAINVFMKPMDCYLNSIGLPAV